MESDRSSTAEAFKALGDQVRWTIVRLMAEQPELPGATLDERLSISRPTISYHIRILVQAGLVDVSKRGRMHYYTLRHDMLQSLLAELNTLMPVLAMAASEADPMSDADHVPEADQIDHRPLAEASIAHTLAAGLKRPAVLPTW